MPIFDSSKFSSRAGRCGPSSGATPSSPSLKTGYTFFPNNDYTSIQLFNITSPSIMQFLIPEIRYPNQSRKWRNQPATLTD